jgi:hypothetical protein
MIFAERLVGLKDLPIFLIHHPEATFQARIARNLQKKLHSLEEARLSRL